jgi:hypothetical protein
MVKTESTKKENERQRNRKTEEEKAQYADLCELYWLFLSFAEDIWDQPVLRQLGELRNPYSCSARREIVVLRSVWQGRQRETRRAQCCLSVALSQVAMPVRRWSNRMGEPRSTGGKDEKQIER